MIAVLSVMEAGWSQQLTIGRIDISVLDGEDRRVREVSEEVSSFVVVDLPAHLLYDDCQHPFKLNGDLKLR